MPDYLKYFMDSLQQYQQAQQQFQQAGEQQDKLAEQKRASMADEAIRGRANDISDGLRKAQEAHDGLIEAVVLNS